MTRDQLADPSVGAALLTDVGPVGGCNVENASYGELWRSLQLTTGGGICAERTAVTKMVVSLSTFSSPLPSRQLP